MISGRVITIGIEQQINALLTRSVKVNDVGSVMMVAGRAVDNVLKKHLRAKKPNKRGFRSSGFWSQIASSVQTFRAGDSAIVQVNDPRFNAHVFGATITPKESKALAIPVHPAAYGVRAATFEDLVMVRSGKGKGNVIGVLGKKTGNGDIIEAWYVLVKSTKVPKDPTALPPDEVMNAEAMRAVQVWISRNVA